MRIYLMAACLFGSSIVAMCLASTPQATSSKGANVSSSAPESPQAKPTNLKVLPKDISEDELNRLMNRYSRELGVPCGYCHEEDPDTRQIDYASDENPLKGTARIMIAMADDINNKYLAQLGDRRYAQPITCGNCHRGQLYPPAFEPPPLK